MNNATYIAIIAFLYIFLKTNDDKSLFSDIGVNIFTFFTFFIFLLLHYIFYTRGFLSGVFPSESYFLMIHGTFLTRYLLNPSVMGERALCQTYSEISLVGRQSECRSLIQFPWGNKVRSQGKTLVCPHSDARG